MIIIKRNFELDVKDIIDNFEVTTDIIIINTINN